MWNVDAGGRGRKGWDLARWILVVPSGFLGFWIAWFAGFLAFDAALLVSSAATWGLELATGSPFEGSGLVVVLEGLAVLILFSGVAGLLTVVVPAALAPSGRQIVAWCAFLVGFAVAWSLAFGEGFSVAVGATGLVFAAVGGIVGVELADGLGRQVDRLVARTKRLEGG